MKFRKEPGFEERVGRAAEAKNKALEALKARPAIDPAVQAERREAHAARLAADAKARADKKAAALAASEAAESDAQLKAAEKRPEPTDAERKAARDARYAARKSRK
ncbi:MAG TPA: DUF6481 family protein [Allosphingosinicella sp.]|jgi:hypothetical protein